MRARRVGLGEVPEVLTEPVVVIDVLRAFTTAPWVLAGGAQALVLASSTAEALAMKVTLGRGAVAITDRQLSPDFELGNSPAQARRYDLAGRPVVQTTMNGTVGVHACLHAPLVLCSSLVTASATARTLLASGATRVTYVITGDDGAAAEDAACADLVHALVIGDQPPVDTVSRVRGSSAAAGLRTGIAAGFSGVDEADIDMACEVDRFDFAVVAHQQNGRIEARPTRSRAAGGLL